jgi:hypothetical protein
MNVRIAILKVLSSYPDGRASYASLKADLAILSTGEWLARMRVLAARAGSIDIFKEKLATRDGYGWTITQAGREFLDRLESGEEVQRTESTRPGPEGGNFEGCQFAFKAIQAGPIEAGSVCLTESFIRARVGLRGHRVRSRRQEAYANQPALDGFILHRCERSAMLSVELKPPAFRGLQRYNGGIAKRLAIVGQGNVQPFKLCGLLKRETDEHAPTHPVEYVVRKKWVV